MPKPSDDSRLGEDFWEADRIIDGLCDGHDLGVDEISNADDVIKELLPTMRLLAETGRNEPDVRSDCQCGRPHLAGAALADFRIIREIGRGGMGVVFEALQTSLNRRVALKILSPTAARDTEKLARFEREAQAAARLEHPRIVRVYASGREHDVYYLAMQYVAGQNLAQFVRRKRAERNSAGVEPSCGGDDETRDFDTNASFAEHRDLSGTEFQVVSATPDSATESPSQVSSGTASYFREIARMGQQAAEAIQHAHEHDIIHRDIKPSNLMLDDQSNVCVTDFGLAALGDTSDLTATGQMLGTLRYCSPEQASAGLEVDARTDVYSLGVTLYELATLRPAFTAVETGALLAEILNKEPVRPGRLAPKIPKDLESIILKAISKAPRHRYQTAFDLAADLQRFLRNEPVEAMQPTWLERGIRWAQRNRTVSFFGTLAALLLVVAAIQLVSYTIRREQLLSSLHLTNEKLDRALSREIRSRQEAESQQRLNRRLYYTADIENLARLADSGNFVRVRQRLVRHQPQPGQRDMRGFVWRYLWASCNNIAVTLDAHEHEVLSTGIASRLNLITTGDKAGSIFIWDAETQQRIASLSYPGEVQDLEFSPDETLLAACGTHGQIHLFDTSNWQLARVLEGHDMTVTSLAFTPGGRTLVSGSRDHHIIFWDTSTWQPRKRFVAHDTVQHISLSRNGRWLASGGDGGETKVWDAETGELVHAFQEHTSAVLCTAWSDDARLIAAGGYDHEICVWDRKTGHRLTRFNVGASSWSLRFLPEQWTLAAGTGNGELRVFDLKEPETPRLIRSIQIHDDKIRSIEFQSGKDRFWSCSDDRKIKIVTGPVGHLGTSEFVSPARSIKFSPDGQRFALGQFDGELAVFDRTGKQLQTHAHGETDRPRRGDSTPSIAYDSDSTLWSAAIDGANVQLRSITSTGESTSQTIDHETAISRFWFSDTAELALTVDASDRASVWSVKTQQELQRFPLLPDVNAAAFAPDNNCVAVATDAGQVAIRSLDGGTLVALSSPADTGLYTVAFDPSGCFVAAGGFDGNVYIWEIESRRLINELSHDTTVTEIKYSSDGQYLAVATHVLSLWHAGSGQFITRLGPEYGKNYECIAFSPADDCLVAAADQGVGSRLHIWDTRASSAEQPSGLVHSP
jgi:WD40 repeat protein/serine/threonine protein kinase